MKALLIAAALFLLAIPSAVHACSCVWSTPATAFNNADAVFIGRMLGGTEKLQETDQNGKPIEAGSVRFAVVDVFKGDLKDEVTIEIASMVGTSCGPYGLSRDVRYLVYAYRGQTNKAVLHTGVCTRTTPAESKGAEEDFKFLRTMPPAGTGGKLEGRIWLDSRVRAGGGAVPMPGLKVMIRGTDKIERVVTTDQDGKFELEKLPAGTYRVEPQVPPNFYVEENSDEVEVADRGTATTAFEAYYTGYVAGRAVDKNGAGYNSIMLEMLSTDKGPNQKHIYGHSTGKNGKFDFEGVPPGSYIIFLELSHDDYKNNREYYYPGTFDRSKATVVKVGLGGRVEGLRFTLPREYEVRTIQGKVLWEDGTPAAGAEVVLRCPTGLASNGLAIESGAETAKADANGNFKIEVFAGETYWLAAESAREGGNGEAVVHFSKQKKILVHGNIKNEILIISPKNKRPPGC